MKLHDWKNKWSAERIVFCFSGVILLLGVFLGIMVDETFFLLSGFVGAMQVSFSVIGFCPLVIILKYFKVVK